MFRNIITKIKTIWKDIRRSNFKRILRQDLEDVYNFYLDDEKRKQLSNKRRLQRWIYVTFWVIKDLILKLTPTRRILLIIALFTFWISRSYSTGDNIQININLLFVGFLLLLLVLALELKDKLLAQNELAAGRAVQLALLPDKNPKLSGWEIWLSTRPANEVGGDLVDYIEISKDRLGLVLADVSGKGLGAALFMARLQATIRALVPLFDSLGEMGTKLNKVFCSDCLPNFFASVVYLELKPNVGIIRILNAGHMPPIIIHGEKLKEMPRGAPALGILRKPTYSEQKIELQQGELLLIYSDGLTEARNIQGDFFGEQRLFNLLKKLKVLSAESVGNRLINEVQQFIGEARPNDDLSLILLKRTY